MNRETLDMINALYKPGDMVNVRVFSDKKGSAFSGAKIQKEMEKFSELGPLLDKHNAENRCISVVVNTGGNENREITRINAQFTEADDLSKDEQMANLDAFPLPPSFIVESEKSMHAYWLMTGDPKVELFRPIQKALVEHFHGDSNVVNEARAMRLPGFNHNKKDTPYPVHFRDFHPERRYTQEQLIEALPEYKAPDGSAPETKEHEVEEGSEPGLEAVMAGCEFLKHCDRDAATLSEVEWYAMISNLVPFKGGREAVHRLSAKYPGYTKEETNAKIDHFLSSKTGPITCRTIAEKGWECPLMKDGTCKCKAPAAKSHEAMSMDAISALADSLPVDADALKNIQTLQDFVMKYLYNVDPSMVSAIVNHKLKSKFKLTVSDINPLLSMQKTLYKENRERSRQRARQDGTGSLPEWYRMTESGLKFMPDKLADYISANEKIIYAAEQFYRYDHGVYDEATDLTIQNLVRKKMIPGEIKMTQISDATNQLKMLVEKDVRELNPNPYLINVQNGMYNVLEDKLIDHSDKYNSTMQLAVTYDPEAQCPRFEQFLHETIEEDQIPLIQEMLGYCLIPVSRAQKAFVLVGEAAAGKSVLLRVISDILLGQENVSHVSWQALNERFKPAELFSKLANVFSDLPSKNIDDNGIFKSLVGEDFITVERKNKNPFSFMSTAVLIFSCNSIPRNYGDRSEGFYRRLILVRYDHSIPEEKRDPDLVEKLKAEADGIFLFAVEGLLRLIRNNYKFSITQANIDELQRYREASNSVLAFVKECCDADPKAVTATSDLYIRYKAYCEESGLNPASMKRMVEDILLNFPEVSRDRDPVSRRRTLSGIFLRAPEL